MDYIIKNHHDCIGCSEDGFLLRGFRCSDDKASIQAEIHMREHMEGWIGIPHGGMGMGAVLELVQGLRNFPNDTRYCCPLNANFRLGGTKLKIGDTISVSVSEVNNGANAKIILAGERDPYLTANIKYNNELVELRNLVTSYLPYNCGELENHFMVLPRYKRCLVCGDEREYPGLNREFYLRDNGTSKLVFSRVGFNPNDKNDFYWFKRGEFIHSVALISLLDETMGWGGFFISGQGGVTVRLEVAFLRDIRIGEKMVVFGRAERKRGKNPKLMFFWSTGGIATVNNNGDFELAAVSSAQFFALPELTEQMKVHLHPAESTRQVFDLAEK
jgi:acyl-coenzyme A thioesterase PaaI-like protein